MNREKSVIDYYVLCNKLKNVIRTGWLDWHVNKERIESVAEHIYGTQMLALAMYSEYQYNIDIMKVLYMLAIHELGEIVIGDLTQFEINKEEKEKMECDAVHNILKVLLNSSEIEKMYLEFNDQNTNEAIFAFQCDKLEADIQSKLYDLDGSVDINKQEDNDIMNNELVKELLDKGYSFSDMWITFGQKRYNYDANFMAVSNYIKNNDIEI
jgi:putative hydrolase of HD superfamily